MLSVPIEKNSQLKTYFEEKNSGVFILREIKGLFSQLQFTNATGFPAPSTRSQHITIWLEQQIEKRKQLCPTPTKIKY